LGALCCEGSCQGGVAVRKLKKGKEGGEVSWTAFHGGLKRNYVKGGEVGVGDRPLKGVGQGISRSSRGDALVKKALSADLGGRGG